MNRKLLYLRIFSVVLMIATWGIFAWELDRILSLPPTDDIFGHAGIRFFSGIFLFLSYLLQWELYGGLKYFLSGEEGTDFKNISKGIAVLCSGVVLAISAVSYLLFRQERFYFSCIPLCVGMLICNRMALGIYTEHITPWSERRGINAIRCVVNVFRYVVLLAMGFLCIVWLMIII